MEICRLAVEMLVWGVRDVAFFQIVCLFVGFRTLVVDFRIQFLGDLLHQTLERKFPDQQIVRLLVSADLPEGHGSRTETMGFLHTSG